MPPAARLRQTGILFSSRTARDMSEECRAKGYPGRAKFRLFGFPFSPNFQRVRRTKELAELMAIA